MFDHKIILETDRLFLRQLTLDDAAFILELVNEPAWLEFIGDKNVHSLADAREYIRNGPIEMYERLGFGLYLVELKQGSAVGICGLIKRDGLDDVDIGFALLSHFSGQGYALEAAQAVLRYGKEVLGLNRIVAITKPANEKSITLLTKLGLQFEKKIRLAADAPEVVLFS
ncbi:MAG: GNAT family N-acetyltransferase [Terriglobales bacterium]